MSQDCLFALRLPLFYAGLTDTVRGRNVGKIKLDSGSVGNAERLTRHAAAKRNAAVIVIDQLREQFCTAVTSLISMTPLPSLSPIR